MEGRFETTVIDPYALAYLLMTLVERPALLQIEEVEKNFKIKLLVKKSYKKSFVKIIST